MLQRRGDPHMIISIYKQPAPVINGPFFCLLDVHPALRRTWQGQMRRLHAAVTMLFLMLAGQFGQAHAAPQTNPVRTIEMDQMDQMMQAENFTGFIVAMTSWCGPCKKELPLFNQLYRKYESRGIQIAAISLDMDGADVVQSLVNRLGIVFPVYWLGPGAVKRYQIFGVPMLIVIKNGKQVKKIPGAQTETQLEKLISTLLEDNS